jgi:hypothetical protein
MHIPPIDLSPLLKILKREGADEIHTAYKAQNNPFSPIMIEWETILHILEVELIPQLAKGGDLSSLVPAAQALQKSATKLSLTASQVLSFVPGPIGIVCSIINAIVCFSAGQILPGIMELLGCIPGAKFGIKGASKILPKIGDEVVSIISKNAELSKCLNNWERLLDKSKLISDDLNFSKITESIEKTKRVIADIERYYPKPNINLDYWS